MKWLNKIKDAWVTKISFRPIIYVTNQPIEVRKDFGDDYRYDIIIGGKVAIQVLRASNEQMLRGYRSSLSIYDESVKDIDFMITRIECMSYDGVMEHTDRCDKKDKTDI